MKHKAPVLADMLGMWRRALIIKADGSRDITTQVRWLQSSTLFIDLRQSAAFPDFLHLRCLDDTTAADCLQLAQQEGFAGHLSFDGECFEWERLIDFQPRAPVADAGRLWWEGEVLIEAGRDIPYVEHWMPDPTVVTRPMAALRLRETQTGVAGIAVQLGTVFMFARDRAISLPPNTTLEQCVVGATSLAVARQMIDSEITLGSAGFGDAAGNLILASSHPWRVSERFSLEFSDSVVRTHDVDTKGQPVTRTWEVLEVEGDPGAVWSAR